MYLTVEEYARAAGGRILNGDPSAFVGGEKPGGLSFDSRILSPGDWFIALGGKTGRNGHEFLMAAIQRGAAGVIISDITAYENASQGPGSPLPAIHVDDTLESMADAARALLEKFRPFTIAITGTVGKTSVKENVTHICSGKWNTLKNPHNWNTEIGVPMSVFDITQSHQVAVLECASRGKGQIRYLTHFLRPHIAVLTAIGPGHLSKFGTIDDVATAKWEIVEGLKPGGFVVAPDDQYTKKLSGDYPVITFGLSETSDVHPVNITRKNDRTEFDIPKPVGCKALNIPGTSRADILNALCSFAIAINVRVNKSELLELEEIRERMKALPEIRGRSEMIVRPDGINIIFDGYNSNPLSLDNALEDLGSREKLADGSVVERRVAILGDMLELGENEKRYHIDAGRKLASLRIDILITVGILGRLIREGADELSGKPVKGEHFDTTESCAAKLPEILKKGDIVLLKASRKLEFEKLLEAGSQKK